MSKTSQWHRAPLISGRPTQRSQYSESSPPKVITTQQSSSLTPFFLILRALLKSAAALHAHQSNLTRSSHSPASTEGKVRFPSNWFYRNAAQYTKTSSIHSCLYAVYWLQGGGVAHWLHHWTRGARGWLFDTQFGQQPSHPSLASGWWAQCLVFRVWSSEIKNRGPVCYRHAH